MADQPGRERRRKVAAVTKALRDLRVELAVLNHRVGKRVELKDLDLDCLDVIARDGPISPSALADRVGVHLATMTGILNRLEEGAGSPGTVRPVTGAPSWWPASRPGSASCSRLSGR